MHRYSWIARLTAPSGEQQVEICLTNWHNWQFGPVFMTIFSPRNFKTTNKLPTSTLMLMTPQQYLLNEVLWLCSAPDNICKVNLSTTWTSCSLTGALSCVRAWRSSAAWYYCSGCPQLKERPTSYGCALWWHSASGAWPNFLPAPRLSSPCQWRHNSVSKISAIVFCTGKLANNMVRKLNLSNTWTSCSPTGTSTCVSLTQFGDLVLLFRLSTVARGPRTQGLSTCSGKIACFCENRTCRWMFMKEVRYHWATEVCGNCIVGDVSVLINRPSRPELTSLRTSYRVMKLTKTWATFQFTEIVYWN